MGTGPLGRWLAAGLLGVSLIAGCHLDRSGQKGSPERRDGGSPDAGRPDAHGLDARPDDGGEDASGADSGPPMPCDPRTTADTVALYTFDADEGTGTVADVTGTHDGVLIGGSPGWVDGPPGCGPAIAFLEGVEPKTYVEIPDSPDWDLAEGSISLWVRYDDTLPSPEMDRSPAILSRDASHSDLSGHLSLLLALDGRLAMRLQSISGTGAIRCTEDPMPTNRWVHIGINLGPPRVELWMDGEPADRTDPVSVDMTGVLDLPCGDDEVLGIDGNDNPWVLGTGQYGSMEGVANNTWETLAPGAMDHLRIESVRRDFEP